MGLRQIFFRFAGALLGLCSAFAALYFTFLFITQEIGESEWHKAQGFAWLRHILGFGLFAAIVVTLGTLAYCLFRYAFRPSTLNDDPPLP